MIFKERIKFAINKLPCSRDTYASYDTNWLGRNLSGAQHAFCLTTTLQVRVQGTHPFIERNANLNSNYTLF